MSGLEFRAARLLNTGLRGREVAKILRVAEQTISKIRKRPHVKAYMDEEREKRIQKRLEKINNLFDDMVEDAGKIREQAMRCGEGEDISPAKHMLFRETNKLIAGELKHAQGAQKIEVSTPADMTQRIKEAMGATSGTVPEPPVDDGGDAGAEDQSGADAALDDAGATSETV